MAKINLNFYVVYFVGPFMEFYFREHILLEIGLRVLHLIYLVKYHRLCVRGTASSGTALQLSQLSQNSRMKLS